MRLKYPHSGINLEFQNEASVQPVPTNNMHQAALAPVIAPE